MYIMWFIIGIILGSTLTWLALRTRAAAAQVALETKLAAVEEASGRLSEIFDALAAKSLRNNGEAFLQLAKQALATHLTQAQGDLDQRKQAVEALVSPLKEALKKIEEERQTAYGGFKTMTNSMVNAQEALAKETRNLALALRTPQVRGRWGESTLRRVVELVGMVEHCDFDGQISIEIDGTMKRPDMIVRLPNQRCVVVDAKTPLDAYLQAIEADSEESRLAALKRHAKQVRDRCQELAAKSYWAALDGTPEFVVLFLPGEPFLAAALQHDPGLIEDAMSQKVVLATPASLFGLLTAVSHGWKQEQLAENARRISQLGREIHDRIAAWTDHLCQLGKHLERAVEAFNKGVGSLEQRVLPSARRFKDLGVSSDKDIQELSPITTGVRETTKDEARPLPLDFLD